MLAHILSVSPVLHAVHTGLLAATTTTTKTAPKKGGSPIFLILLVVLAGGYLWMRSQRNKAARTQRAQTREVEVGDEITTTSGIIGHVRALHDDRVSLEIAPGTVITVMRQAIGRHVEPPVPDSPADDDHEDEDGDLADHAAGSDAPGSGPTRGEQSWASSAHRPTELPELHAPNERQRHEHPGEDSEGPDDASEDEAPGRAAAGGSS